MAKYLNPKADLTFKKVFGEHKDLSTRFAALYGYPQRLMNDKYVVMFLKDYVSRCFYQRTSKRHLHERHEFLYDNFS